MIASLVLLAVAAASPPEGIDELPWTDPVPVLRRAEMVVEYRAVIAGESLIVEVRHAPNWHTYAMDNVQRAQAKTGKDRPDCELPTTIAVDGALQFDGKWSQSKPKDLSTPDIHWYTWGFEDLAYFVVPVMRISGGDTILTVNAQACNASQCSIVSDLRIVVAEDEAASEVPEALFESLVPLVSHEVE